MPRELKPCGTLAAYRRHYLHGEKPCEPCAEANRAYQKELYRQRNPNPRPTGRPETAKCGTRSGYMAHRRRNELACQACLDATAAVQRSYRAAAKAAAEKQAA